MTTDFASSSAARYLESRRVFFALFAVLAFLELWPVWALPYVPNQAGGAHIYNATVLLWQNDWPLVREYFDIRLTVAGNFGRHLLLGALLPLVGPLAAEKLVVTILVLLLPAGGWLVLRAAGARNPEFALWAFLLGKGPLFYLGMWNFLLALGLLLVVVALFVRDTGRWSPGRIVALALLSGVVYSFHSVPWLMMAGFAGLWWLWARIVECGAGFWRGLPAALRRVAPAAFALLWPAAALLLYIAQGEHFYEVAPDRPINNLWLFYSGAFLSNSAADLMSLRRVVMGFIALLAALALFRRLRGRFRFESADALLLMAGASCCALAYLPPNVGTFGFVNQRFALNSGLLLLLWLGCQRWSGWLRLAGITLCVASVAVHSWHGYRLAARWQPALAELASAGAAIPAGVTVLPVQANMNTSSGFNPLLHPAGFWSPKEFVDLRNYEAFTPHFPIRYRPEYDPGRALGHIKIMESAPAVFSVRSYETLRRGRVDVVVVYGAEPATILDRLPQRAWDPQGEFQLVKVTGPRRLAYIYRRSGS